MGKRFFITGLPRSRTAWLANFLTFGASFCYHEGLLGCRSLDDLYRKMDALKRPVCGDADTALLHFVSRLREENPEAEIVLIVRSLVDVTLSHARLGAPTTHLMASQAKLEEARPYCSRVIAYDSLGDEQTVKGLYTSLTGLSWSHARWTLLRDTVVQMDLKKFCAKVLQERNSLEELFSEVRPKDGEHAVQ